jgi:hypothetical protein
MSAAHRRPARGIYVRLPIADEQGERIIEAILIPITEAETRRQKENARILNTPPGDPGHDPEAYARAYEELCE